MRSFIVAVCLFVIGVVLQAQTAESGAPLLPGCCKQNTNGVWREISRDFNRCQELNARFDYRDDIYSPQGTFWWDSNCR